MKHRSLIVTLVGALFTTGITLAAPPAITELVPESTIAVFGVHNTNEVMAKLKATSLWDLWETDHVKELRSEAMDEFNLEIKDMLEELGLDEDTLAPPTGELGFALFSVIDEELGMPIPGILITADYGENADKTEELIAAAIDKGQEEGELHYEERQVSGRTVLCFEIPKDHEDDMWDDGDEFEDDEFMMDEGFGPMAGPPSPLDSIDTIFYLREQNSFMLSTDMATLAGALDVIDGEGAGLVPARSDFQGVSAQIGAGDMYGILLTRDVSSLIAPLDTMGIMGMVSPLLQQLFGHVSGIGFNFRVDGETAMVEETVGIYMPHGKAGLTALATKSTPIAKVPSFVGPNTYSYSTLNYDFAGLPDALKPVFDFAQMFMAMGEPVDPNQPKPEDVVRNITSCLGSTVYIVQTLDRPITATSLNQIIAVDCTDPRMLEQRLAAMGPLIGRDFLGHRIFTIDDLSDFAPPIPIGPPMGGMGGGMDMAVGIGGGYVFAGPTVSVEQALRTIGEDNQPTIEGNPAFRRALAALGDDTLVGWGYADVIDAMEGPLKVTQLQMEEMMKEFAAEDPELAEEFQDMDMGDVNTGLGMLEKIDYDLIREYIGPSSWALYAREDGFVMRSFMLSVSE